MNEENQSAEKREEEKSNLDLENSLKECQDKYLRLLAESENARKRMHKERQELTKYAVENVVVEFLQPLDSFEKALRFAESSSKEVKQWAEGFEMLLNQFKQILSNHNVYEYDSIGQHFDPHLHEALEVVETDEYEPGTVIHEFTKGHKMDDRVIRVARVKVAKKIEKPEEKNNQGEKQ